MTFNDFLKLLATEKFSFKVDYIDWSNQIKVTVDTFSRIEIYKFGATGITEYSELQEVLVTEDNDIINQKLQELADRTLKAWIEASSDLGFRFIHPYRFTGVDALEYQTTGLLPDFGKGKGTLIISRKDDDVVFEMAELTNDYYLSSLNPYHYDKYNRENFIETLSDWGWIGEGEKPNWIVNN